MPRPHLRLGDDDPVGRGIPLDSPHAGDVAMSTPEENDDEEQLSEYERAMRSIEKHGWGTYWPEDISKWPDRDTPTYPSDSESDVHADHYLRGAAPRRRGGHDE